MLRSGRSYASIVSTSNDDAPVDPVPATPTLDSSAHIGQGNLISTDKSFGIHDSDVIPDSEPERRALEGILPGAEELRMPANADAVTAVFTMPTMPVDAVDEVSTMAPQERDALPNEDAPSESGPLRYAVAEDGNTHPVARVSPKHSRATNSDVVSGPKIFNRELLALGNDYLLEEGEPEDCSSYHDEQIGNNVFARVYESLPEDDVKETLRR
ncbi:hypothetical protein M407DRAFT_7141 [Tulasnella calospora MUT 4182]|uniref:Uncharacterized protein n=1 Tax=Tulasnella calospora MUT 4182 TaxID=1051891 RepID=A0A0C3QB81_9AGAM|nr:hypothetical protein M407DRAFT_7141 [Tulasnella calospora MUT 4182]